MANEKQIEFITNDINEANQILNSGDTKKSFDFFEELSERYRPKNITIYDSDGYNLDDGSVYFDKYPDFLRKFIKRLELYKAELEDTKNNIPNSTNSINISNSSTATINQNITFKSTLKNINELSKESLPENLKNELIGMLTILENHENEEQKKSKFQEILKWLSDKSVDVAIACLPWCLDKFLK